MSAIAAILFDAGGTLIHVDGERVCRAAGVPFDKAAFAAAETGAIGRLRDWIVRHPESTDAGRFPVFLNAILAGLGVEEGAFDEASRRIALEHRRANLWSRAVEGAGGTLETLKRRGYRLGVISNADGRVRRLLEDAGLTPHLEVVLDSSEIGLEKPDPRIFFAAAERLGLPPASCAYVGDLYEIDVLGARSAGLRPILVGSDPSPEPVERIAALEELLDLFAAP